MKAKFGAIVVDGRGKLGGHVASKNRAGSYFRTKVTPVNPKSTAQVLARARLITPAIAWSGLTAAQRLAWNVAVPLWQRTDIFGDLKAPSGFNLYVKLNNNLAQIGVAPISIPPLPAAIGNWTTFSFVAATAGTLIVTFAPTPVPAGFAVLMDGIAPVNQGRYNVAGRYRRFTFIAAAVATGVDLGAVYIAKFGSIGPIGKKIFLHARYINIATGQVGAQVEASWIIAA
jgi:hypothetical protein